MLSKFKVSSCGTHHINDDIPLYDKRFDEVLKFHPPGLAPVKDQSGAYHIDSSGTPAYQSRFNRTFGFYEGLAAIENEEGAFHINPEGTPAYAERYAWCGNFQEGLCPVRDLMGSYFHITVTGIPLYGEKYHYAGDFKDGVAVVCNDQGLSTHINNKGHMIHSQWFEQLDIFHKGFARAKDKEGWFHVDMKGEAIYQRRFEDLEPFYNGVAHARDQTGSLLLINEKGETLQNISCRSVDNMGALSSDMVGFWRSFTIYTALQLKVLDFLPNATKEIAKGSSLPVSSVQRILKALWELDIVNMKTGDYWELTSKGKLMTPSDKAPMAFAGQMWIENNLEIWKTLPEILRDPDQEVPDYFLDIQKTPNQQLKYYKALEGYALNDYKDLPSKIDWSQHKNILDVGGGLGSLLFHILSSHSHLEGTLLDLPSVTRLVKTPQELQKRCHLLGSNFFEDWGQTFDALIMCRILHDWKDSKALKILEQASLSLTPKGRLYIIEMITDENTPMGGLLDLNMLATTGGKERSLHEWEHLLEKTSLSLKKVTPLSDISSLLEVGFQ